MDQQNKSESGEQHLTEEFYRSRRSLALFSGLLLSWELLDVVGIDQDKAVGVFKVENPEAVPWVFVALIFYFMMRTGVEWYQSPESRRQRKASIFDLYATAVIVIMALAVPAQGIISTRFANTNYEVFLFSAAFALAPFSFFLNVVAARTVSAGCTWSIPAWPIPASSRDPYLQDVGGGNPF